MKPVRKEYFYGDRLIYLKENKSFIISDVEKELKNKDVTLVTINESLTFFKDHFLSQSDYLGALLYCVFQTNQLNTKRKIK